MDFPDSLFSYVTQAMHSLHEVQIFQRKNASQQRQCLSLVFICRNSRKHIKLFDVTEY